MERADAGAVRSMAAAHPGIVNATHTECFGAMPLLHAVNADDRAMVDLLLDLGGAIDQRSDWWAGGFGVLDSASDDMAAHLLQRGAILTPHAAARLGMIDRLRAMLDADPAAAHARGGDGQLPLHFARTTGIADLLLDRGATIDALDIDHASTAAQWLGGSRPRVAAHLVSRGAAPDPFLAARIGDVALLARLLEKEHAGVDVRVTRQRFPAPAPAAGHIYLYTIGEGCTLLHAAAGVARDADSAAAPPDHAAVIRWLGQAGADLNARAGYDDGTPLHTAAWNDNAEAARALLDAGADPGLPSGALHRNEPLGWAIVGGAERVVRLFLERGVPIRPHHKEDARAGARGQFRRLHRDLPIERWRAIERLVGA